MESETLFRLVTAFFGILGAAKLIYEFTSGSKSKLREEYRFAKEFLNDINQSENLHPFAIEKGYYAIAGTTSIKSKEIEYILSLENPDKCLKDYVLSRRYLEHINDNGNFKIDFSNKYKSKFSRQWRKLIYIIIYIVGAFIALSPFVLYQALGLNLKQFITFLLVVAPVFGYFAIDSLRLFMKIKCSEKLVGSQNKHTNLIVLKNGAT